MVLDFDNCEYILHYEIFNDSVYTLCYVPLILVLSPHPPTLPHHMPTPKRKKEFNRRHLEMVKYCNVSIADVQVASM